MLSRICEKCWKPITAGIGHVVFHEIRMGTEVQYGQGVHHWHIGCSPYGEIPNPPSIELSE